MSVGTFLILRAELSTVQRASNDFSKSFDLSAELHFSHIGWCMPLPTLYIPWTYPETVALATYSSEVMLSSTAAVVDMCMATFSGVRLGRGTTFWASSWCSGKSND